MKRSTFVAAAAAMGTLGATPSPPPHPPQPSPSPTPSPSARDFAMRMRAFDPQLSNAELEAIATGIDGNWKLGDSINPKGTALQNWDEPTPSFRVNP
jgi:hypothetical protein